MRLPEASVVALVAGWFPNTTLNNPVREACVISVVMVAAIAMDDEPPLLRRRAAEPTGGDISYCHSVTEPLSLRPPDREATAPAAQRIDKDAR